MFTEIWNGINIRKIRLDFLKFKIYEQLYILQYIANKYLNNVNVCNNENI